MKQALILIVALFCVQAAVASDINGPKSSPSSAKCSESNANVDVPTAPHGLFIALFPGSYQRRRDEIDRYLLHNPVVCGANVYIVWSKSDRGPGSGNRYDFGYVDDEMAPWLKAGKMVNLVVWAVSDVRGESATPNYVLSKAPTVECEKFGRVPVFWDKAFSSNYKDFMAAVVQKYGTDSNVGYIRFGLGAGGETFPACQFALRRNGFSPRVWQDYIFDMLDYEKSLHSERLLMVGINSFGERPDMNFPHNLAQHAVEAGIAIGSQGLRGQDIEADARGEACKVDWCNMFRSYRGKIPLELQSFKPSHPDGSDPGSLVDMLAFALKLHVQIIEVLLPDWMLAYNPNAPGYDQYHAQYQRALETTANALNGS